MLRVETLESDSQEAGIYTWHLDDDRLYGDTAIALLFGLDPASTLRGLPLQTYLDRVHVDDQRELARAISHVVKSGDTYYAEYRVMNASGQYRLVMALGRCFRNQQDNPSFYSGIIYPIDRLS